ncbi:MAG: preprotein translocase subunit SecG [Oscillospiraceae bacterium]|nr:preprotein translocase subunit SecG [Oscillospiraceae bacterium]
MSIIEIVGGIILLITALLIIVLCLMQDSKQDQNMTSAITGGSYDSAFSKNEGNTKEAIMKKWTKWLTIIFFIVTLVVIIVPVYIGE